METYDYNVEDFDSRYQADRGVHGRFYIQPCEDRRASAEAGRAIFKDVEFIEIIASGNQNNIVRRKATEEDKMRFRRQYEMFQKGCEEQLVGTPLKEVAWLTRSQVEELAYLRLYTLEALANVSDDTCGKHAGLYEIKRRAQSALEQAEGMAPLTQLQEENAQLKKQLVSLQQQVKELAKAEKKG